MKNLRLAWLKDLNKIADKSDFYTMNIDEWWLEQELGVSNWREREFNNT